MTRRPPDPDRLAGCLLGGGIGDALGAPVEGMSLGKIRARYGPDGIRDYVDERFGAGAITDDTQMTLFTVEALLNASVRARAKGIGGATAGMLQAAYIQWLQVQGEDVPDQDVVVSSPLFAATPGMRQRRGPGRTCLSALHAAAARRRPGVPLGTVEKPINDSKGCGGVMRAAPAGFPYADPAAAFNLGCTAAALTHGHPSGYLSAGTMAATVCGLVRGAELPHALEAARAELERHRGHEETSTALDAATVLAGRGWPAPEELETLGAGWVGEEALAIGVCAALAANRLIQADGVRRAEAGRRGLLLAVNHSGDSDSTGGLCGSLLGSRFGTAALPGRWQAGLEVRDTVLLLAADAAVEFGGDPPAEDDGYGTPPASWFTRHAPS
jgi:ADP-ribosylglycohydrolase